MKNERILEILANKIEAAARAQSIFPWHVLNEDEQETEIEKAIDRLLRKVEEE